MQRIVGKDAQHVHSLHNQDFITEHTVGAVMLMFKDHAGEVVIIAEEWK